MSASLRRLAAFVTLLATLNWAAAYFALAQVGGGVVNGGQQSGVAGSSGPVATVTSCGTSPFTQTPINNSFGTVTEGTSTAGCAVIFNPPRNGPPTCQVTSRSGSTVPVLTYTPSATGLAWTNATATNIVFDYMCFGS